MSTAVTYALEGRAVTSNEFFDVIAGGGRQLAIQQMTAKIEGVICTQHGEGAVVTRVGNFWREVPEIAESGSNGRVLRA